MLKYLNVHPLGRK